MKQVAAKSSARKQLGTFLNHRDLEAIFKMTGKRIHQLVCQGRFPAPVRIGRACRWRAEDVERYILELHVAAIRANDAWYF